MPFFPFLPWFLQSFPFPLSSSILSFLLLFSSSISLLFSILFSIVSSHRFFFTLLLKMFHKHFMKFFFYFKMFCKQLPQKSRTNTKYFSCIFFVIMHTKDKVQKVCQILFLDVYRTSEQKHHFPTAVPVFLCHHHFLSALFSSQPAYPLSLIVSGQEWEEGPGTGVGWWGWGGLRSWPSESRKVHSVRLLPCL